MGNRIGWILLGTGVGLALIALFALPWYAGDAWSAGHNHTVPCAAIVGNGCVVSDANTWLVLVLTVVAAGLAVARRLRPQWGALWCVGIGIAGIGIASAAFTANYGTFNWFPTYPFLLADSPLSWNPGTGLIVSVIAAGFVVAAALVWLFAGSERARRLPSSARDPRVQVGRAALVGSGLAVLGSLMPWADVAAVGGWPPTPGASAFAVCAVLAAAAYLRRGGRSWAGALLLAATVVSSIAADQLAQLAQTGAAVGLYLYLVGGMVAVLAAAVLLALEYARMSLSRAVGLGSVLIVLVCAVVGAGAVHVSGRPQPCQSGGVFGITANGKAFSRCLGP